MRDRVNRAGVSINWVRGSQPQCQFHHLTDDFLSIAITDTSEAQHCIEGFRCSTELPIARVEMESKPDTKARASVNCGSGSLLPTGGMWDVGVPPPQCCTAGARRRVVGRRASGGVRPSRRRIAARITRADSPRRLERSGDDKSQPTACGARESSLSRRSLVSVYVCMPHFISVMPWSPIRDAYVWKFIYHRTFLESRHHSSALPLLQWTSNPLGHSRTANPQ